jgi:hypothetical protein
LYRYDYGDSEDQDSVASSYRLDSSFQSFVNSTETVGDEEQNLEMVFHNKALLKIVGVQTTKDLHAFINKHVFISREYGNRLSLMSTA